MSSSPYVNRYRSNIESNREDSEFPEILSHEDDDNYGKIIYYEDEENNNNIEESERSYVINAMKTLRKTPLSPYRGYYMDVIDIMGSNSNNFIDGQISGSNSYTYNASINYKSHINKPLLFDNMSNNNYNDNNNHSNTADNIYDITPQDSQSHTSNNNSQQQQMIIADDLEFKLKIRARDYREQLAYKFRIRMDRNIIKITFQSWRTHIFRFKFLQSQMIHCFLLRGLSLKFHGWHAIARRERILRKAIRRYWRGQRKIKFVWWKCVARWRSVKVRLLRKAFGYLSRNYRKKLVIYRKLYHMSRHYKYHTMASLIQLNFKLYRNRKIFWAWKTIKEWFWSKFYNKIIYQRARVEEARMKDEEVVYKAIVIRANKFLKDKLEDKEGADLLKTYLVEVDAAVRREGRAVGLLSSRRNDTNNKSHSSSNSSKIKNEIQPVFPSKEDDPQLASLYTTRAKAMYVLNKRSELDVIRLSREKFRRTSRPLYHCRECLAVFLSAEQCRLHSLLGCPHTGGIHSCQSWIMAKEITNIALERLMTSFFHNDTNYSNSNYKNYVINKSGAASSKTDINKNT